MSISVAIKIPDAIVLATDSRLSVSRDNNTRLPDTLYLDSVEKVFLLGPPNTHVAVTFVGDAQTGIRSFGSLVREYGENVGIRKTVEEITRDLHTRLGPAGIKRAAFTVAGYDQTNRFGRMFRAELPGSVAELFLGASWGVATGGKDALAVQVLKTVPPDLEIMTPLAAAELAAWLIGLTATGQKYSLSVASVGGPVQTALLRHNRPVRLLGEERYS